MNPILPPPLNSLKQVYPVPSVVVTDAKFTVKLASVS